MDIEILLNDFAIRSFRDIGDNDYVSARMAYRGQLISQFLWSGLQAIEKYLKCILLLNRIPANKMRHDLAAGLNLIKNKAPFELRLCETSRELIKHFDTYGRFRYLETPFHVKDVEIIKLDLAVWEIRRYCKVLDYQINLPDGAIKPMLQLELDAIGRSEEVLSIGV